MDAEKGTHWLAGAYAAAIFLSALLLFQIQPLVSKHLLPWFGGSPAVWTTCLLFFQTLLVAGYAYAHFSNRWLWPGRQALLHIALLVMAAAVLLAGVLPERGWQADAGGDPSWQILLTLALSVGLPYFVLSATGPLLQAWFGRSFPSRAPYRLYALSNSGSLIALLSYPFVLERLFDLPLQARIWSWGFVIFAFMCGLLALNLRRGLPPPQPSRQWGGSKTTLQAGEQSPRQQPDGEAPSRPRLRQYLLWLVWPAMACVMLMSTTNHISTDIAATPFLWVVPLALYLLTLIVAFDRPHWYRPVVIAVLTLAALWGTGLVHKEGVGTIRLYDCGTPGRLYRLASELATHPAPAPLEPIEFRVDGGGFLLVNLCAMFGVCLICHGELVRQRPDPRYLTAFYLMIAAGGALGGAFVALVAPSLFSTYFEWELSLYGSALLCVGILLPALVHFAIGDVRANPARMSMVPPLAIGVLLASSIVLLDLTEFLQPRGGGTQYRVRNFFGAISVHERAKDDPLVHDYVLRHGVITHGAQFVHPSRRRQPTTYFGPTSGIGRTIHYYKSHMPAGQLRMAVVGLGIGTLATYVDAGEAITFYELNPAIVDIAESQRWFTYLSDSRDRGGLIEVRLGDARLSLESERQAGQPLNCQLLVLDAFSGDSIPMHLLTAEAFETYLSHAASIGRPDSTDSARDEIGGAIAVNVSNRFVDIEPVLRGVADRYGLDLVRIHNKGNRADAIYSADWVILSRNEGLMDELAPFARQSPEANQRSVLWTDKRSSLFDVLK